MKKDVKHETEFKPKLTGTITVAKKEGGKNEDTHKNSK